MGLLKSSPEPGTCSSTGLAGPQLPLSLLGTWVHDSLQWRRRLKRNLHGTGKVAKVWSAMARTLGPRELFLLGGARCLQQGLQGAREKKEQEGPIGQGSQT